MFEFGLSVSIRGRLYQALIVKYKLSTSDSTKIMEVLTGKLVLTIVKIGQKTRGQYNISCEHLCFKEQVKRIKIFSIFFYIFS